jgi:hypothetical protein
MDNVQNCDSYINILLLQTDKSFSLVSMKGMRKPNEFLH